MPEATVSERARPPRHLRWQPVLHVHRAERADALVDALGELLAAPLADPFAPEVVAVPTRGMERWLTQRLSAALGATPGRRDGVCANVEFPFPRRLVGDAVAAASGIDPDDRPVAAGARGLAAARGRRRVAATSRGCAALADHLGDDATPTGARAASPPSATSPSCSTATRCTGPRCCARGRAGEDAATAGRPSCGGGCASGSACPSPAERLDARVRARCARDPALVDLPERALAVRPDAAAGRPPARCCARSPRGRDVHLFLLHPSPALWEQVARAAPPVVRRADDRTAALPSNRLLASWGQDARELQLVLGAHEHVDHHHPVAHRGATRCSRASRPTSATRPPSPEPRAARPDDRSVQVHACHGRARQVEVAARRDPAPARRRPDARAARRHRHVPGHRDVRAADPGDVRRGRGRRRRRVEPLPEELRPPDLRVRLADRSLRQTNPVLGVVARLLELAGRAADRLAGARPRRPRAGPPPLPARRRRPRADRRTGSPTSGIRWGLDAAHRAPFKLERRCPRGTWRAGLDRAAARRDDDRGRASGCSSGVLPLDDVESGAIDLAGRLRRARRPAAGGASTRFARRKPIGDVGGGARRRPPTR